MSSLANTGKTDPLHFQVKSFLVLTKWVYRCALVPPCVELGVSLDYHPGTNRHPFVVHQLYDFGNTKEITCKIIRRGCKLFSTNEDFKK